MTMAKASARTRHLEVRLEGLDLRRAGRAVLKKVSWHIRPGERWVLLGENGSGKTQLLKVVAGTVWPAPASRPTLRYRLRGEVHDTPYAVKDHIAYLGAERQDQYERYGWNMSVERLVGTGIYGSDIPLQKLRREDRLRIRRLLPRVGLPGLGGRSFLTLSYGERRLALLARALASRPKLLLLDEAFSGLDAVNRARLMRWLQAQRGALPWVLATHHREDVPESATHALVLRTGRIAYAGTLRRVPLRYWPAGDKPGRHRPPRAAHARKARSAAGAPLVHLRGASVHLDGHRVLQDISLSVRAGEFWVIHGENGSGKTTLLRTLYGDHGVAVGRHVARAGIAPGVPLERFRRRVGLIAPHLQAEYPRNLTVDEVVQSGRHASIGLSRPPSAAERAATRRALRRLKIANLARRTLAELSYGQARRVLFARALAHQPKLLLLDEPLAGLDAATRRELADCIRSLAARGVTVVVTAHREREWRGLATHEMELRAGRVLRCTAARVA
jgi:molybdate transport system ATP-binding protein